MTDPNNLAPESSPEVVFRLSGIAKRFGATEALRGVDLTLVSGEFVALLGSNGAGKSTLIRILDGVERQDSGSVEVAAGNRLGIVHQDLGLVDYMTVAENLFFGTTSFWLRPGVEVRETRAALDAVSLDVDPHRLVETLSLGERTMLAVAKLFHRGAKVVVVDEVTAGLSTEDARWLVTMLRDAAHRGSTVMMVTHRLREVEGIADRYVVLADGAICHDGPASETSFDDLVDLMTADTRAATATLAQTSLVRRTNVSADVVCTLAGVTYRHIGPVDLELLSGTIVGVTGTLGSGIHDLAYILAGLVRPDSGAVTVAPDVRRSCVPAHRESEGVFPDESEEFNLSAGMWQRWRTSLGLLRTSTLRSDCLAVARQLDIKPADLGTPVARLSGGNQQKTILGRALVDEPQLLVLCEPTRGVDVATRQEIYSQVRAAADRGAAVFVASSDLEDLAALADRTGLLGQSGQIERWVGRADIGSLSLELV